MYSNLDEQEHVKKTYGEDVMVVAVKHSSKRTFKIPDTAVHRRDVEVAT